MPDIDILLKSTAIGIDQVDKTAKAYVDLEKGIAATNEEMKEAEKIQRKYGVSLKGAQEIMRRTHPEIREIEKIQKDLNVSTAEATKIYNASSKQMTSANTSMKSMIKTMVGTGVALLAAKKAWDFTKESIGLASDAMEEHSKLHTVFSGLTEQTNGAVKDLTDNFGFSTLQAERMFAATGDLLAGFGFNEKAMFDLSLQTQKLAADLASFTNIEGGAARASAALTKLLVGETEPAKQLGIVVRQDTKEFKDMVKELQRTEGATLLQAKAMASLNIAVKQSQLAMGDFARTQDSFANQSKILQATVEDLKVEFGKVFVETILPLLTGLSKWMKDNKDLIISGFEGIGKAVNFLAGAFQAVGLASQVLDNIDKIADSQKNAAESMQEYANKLLDFRFQAEFLGKDMSKLDEAIDLFQVSTGDANQKFAELNAIWTDIKSGEFGEHVAEQFKAFNAEFLKTVDAQNKGAESTKKVNQELTAAQKIMEQYGVSLSSANAILKAQNPELGEIQKLQKSLNVSLEEAAKVYGIVNKLEKERKETLKETPKESNIIIPDTIEFNDDYTESLKGLDTEMENVKRQQEATAAGFESEYNEAVINTTGSVAGLTDEMIKQQQEWENLKLGVKEFVNIAAGALDAFTSIASRAGKSGEKIAQWGDILGGAVNSILSGDFLGATLSLVGNMDKLADALWGVSDAGPTFAERVADADDMLSDFAGTTDIAAANLANFLHQVELGNYQMDEFNQYMQDSTNYLQQGGDQLYSWGTNLNTAGMSLDEINQGLDDYNALLAEAAGTDPGAIGEAMKTGLAGLNDLLAGGAQGQMEFNDQVNLTMGVFANLMKSGESIVSVLGMMGDSFDKLIETQKMGALSSSESYKSLLSDNEDLIKSVNEYGDAISKNAELELSQKQILQYTKDIEGQYDKLIDAGFSHAEAMGTLGPSLNEIQANAEKYGTELDANTQRLIDQAAAASTSFEGSGLFEELAKFRTLIKDNEALVKSVEGFNTLLGATAELGEISQKQLSSFAREASREFEKLTEAGFSQNQALQMLGPSLKTLEENASRYGHTIDANTQKLIDQAREAGVFEEMANPLDTIANILEQIFFQLGGTGDALSSFGDTADKNTATTNDGLQQVEANIQKIGDTTMDTANTMAQSMGGATESIQGDILNMQDESLKSFNAIASDATAAANDMANGFKNASNDSLESIKNFTTSAGKQLGALGGNLGLRPQPPLLQGRPDVPRAQNGIQGVVPPGFNNDDFLIRARSGEPVNIGRPGERMGGSGKTEINIQMIGGSKEEMARNFIDAWNENLLEMRTKTTG